MTDKQKELNNQYVQLCIKLGDVSAKLMFNAEIRKDLNNQAISIKEEINKLNAQMLEENKNVATNQPA